MVKTLKSGAKKEKGADKRKRRENIVKAREHARRYVIPIVILLFSLLAAFLIYRFGMGTKLTSEERSKIRSQKQLTKLMREHGTDFSKLREILCNKKDSVFATEPKVEVENVQAPQVEDDEAVVEWFFFWKTC